MEIIIDTDTQGTDGLPLRVFLTSEVPDGYVMVYVRDEVEFNLTRKQAIELSTALAFIANRSPQNG